MEKSIFKKIIEGEIPCFKIYEDKNTFAFLDINPFEKGHTLVIPKTEYKNIFEIPENEYINLMITVKKVATKIKNTLNCDINIIQNNGPKAHQEIMHIHFHIIPRTENKKLYNLNDINPYKDNSEAEEFKNKIKLN